MKKRAINIINFLNLSKERYYKILEYRNQDFVREVSNGTNYITLDEHTNYLKLLEKKDKFFAFLILVDGKDYGVVSLKKTAEDTCYIGHYLVDELYKFEGGGVVARCCISYICTKLNVRYTSYSIKTTNTRGFRTSCDSAKVVSVQEQNGFYEGVMEILNFNSDEFKKSKSKKLFDKLYEINDCEL